MWEEGGGRRTSPGAGSERWSGFPWQLPSWYLAGKAPKVVNSFFTEATAYSGSILMLLPHGLPNLICRTGSELHIIDQYVFEALPSLTGI